MSSTRLTDERRQQIRQAREQEGLSLGALVERFGHSKSTIYTIIKPCDSSRVHRAAPTRKVVPQVTPKERPPLSKADLGEAARQVIVSRLMLAGIKVFRPMTEDTPIDLLVLMGTDVAKCQCKYIYPASNGSHRMPLCSVRKNNPAKKAVRHLYTEDEVDYFLGYCLDNDTVYVIPHAEGAQRHELIFWILRQSHGHVVFDPTPWASAYHLLLP